MKHDYSEAKRMYLYYMGNGYFMAREGDYDKYKSFNVPLEMEEQWDIEIRENLKKRILEEKNFNNLCSLCSALVSKSSGTNVIDGLEFVYKVFIERHDILDTFTNILLIECIFRESENFIKIDRKITFLILKDTLDFLIKLEKKPIVTSKDYNNSDGSRPDYLNEENIIKRIKQDIKKYSDMYYKLKEENKIKYLK
jgi:hypothetical protein